MFNFSKKNESGRATKYPAIVEEIHTEFHTAADRLLEEAKQAISEASTKDIGKVVRLEKLGFKQANQVSELKPLIQKAEMSKEQIGLVEYYSLNYPLNKFITEEQVKTICFKYNLVCGPVGRYKGFVPEKNLKEIESFQLNKNDAATCFREVNTGELFFLGESDFTETGKRYCRNNAFYIVGHNEVNIYGSDPLLTDACLSRYSHRSGLLVKPETNSLQICAPVKDMDLSGMTIEDGYKVQKIHIPDPVVLKPVKGGYLIVTAWGDEASDEDVVNQKMN